ncbi:MAG: carboxypeptidase regulatory-like domain-containing protein [Deltaproteobacteria bacterium]|nr:carboxypeptidase regulatory-like domain-containing protein [Deltaproteobacteria bacterium]
MRNRTLTPTLSVLGLSAALLLAAVPVGCGDDGFDNAARGAAARSPAAAPVPVGPAPTAEAPSSPRPPPLDVSGRVVAEREEPVVGRTIRLVDRAGRHAEVLTDEDGGFHVEGVTPPYDVLIAPAPSGAILTPVAYLGLARSDPRLSVFEPRGPEIRPASESIKVGVHLPPCRASSGACWISVVSASPSGGGTTASSYTEGTPFAVLEVDHAWLGERTRPGEVIDVHVLVGSADYTEYAYARIVDLPVRPGETIDAGMLTPARIDATEPVTVAAQAESAPEGWQWTLTTSLDLAAGVSFPLLYQWAPSAVLRLPRIPGATFRVGAWMQHPAIETQSYFHRSSQAWSGTLPLGVGNVALAVPLGPELVRPTAEGRLSRRGAGYAWAAKARGLHTLVVADLARGRQVMRAHTSDPSLALTAVEALGVRRLEPGEHVLDLTSRADADVDELTQPDERVRTRRFGREAPGAETYQRFRFVVTP